MPLGCAATHNDGMVCERPEFLVAWVCRAELSCAVLQKREPKKLGEEN